MIDIEHVSYRYPAFEDEEETQALSDVNLHIGEGEFVAVLGHNGSGKSTLARLLNAQMVPTKGDICIAGMNTKDHDKLWDIRATCGMVFQNPDNQLVASIVEEDVAFGPENLGIAHPKLREVVDMALSAVGMTEYKRRAPHNLSGGQKQRVAIAGVLAMEPSCIIMDEPTAMLDPVGRREILETIHYLNREEKKTILLITHFMEEAVHADRIVILSDGKVAMEGTPKEVFSRVEEMRALKLDVPQVTELSYRLNREGFSVPADALTIEELLGAFE